MKGSAQVVRGRIKEAAGALTGDDKLRASGQADQAVGQVRQVAEKSIQHVKESVQKVADTARKVARKTAD